MSFSGALLSLTKDYVLAEPRRTVNSLGLDTTPSIDDNRISMPSQQKNQVSAFFIARLLGEIGFIIAIPLVGSVFLGRWLDIQLGFRALFIFVGIVLALVTSSIVIYRKIQKLSD